MINISLVSGLVLSLTLTSAAGAIVATTASVAVPYFQSENAEEIQAEAATESTPDDQLETESDAPAAQDSSGGNADGYDLGSNFDDYEGRFAASGYDPRNMPVGVTARSFSGGWAWSYVGPCVGSKLETIVRGNNGQILSRGSSSCVGSANPTFAGGSVAWDVYTENAFCGYGAGGPVTAYRAEVMGMVSPWIATPTYQCQTPATPAPTPAPAPAPAPAPQPTPTPEPSPEPSQEPTPTPTAPTDETP